jgi:hypothetical protein
MQDEAGGETSSGRQEHQQPPHSRTLLDLKEVAKDGFLVACEAHEERGFRPVQNEVDKGRQKAG